MSIQGKKYDLNFPFPISSLHGVSEVSPVDTSVQSAVVSLRENEQNETEPGLRSRSQDHM